MAQKFKKGDIVELVSGGPKMTVERYKVYHGMTQEYESEDEVEVTWFDKDHKIQSRTFQQESLVRSKS